MSLGNPEVTPPSTPRDLLIANGMQLIRQLPEPQDTHPQIFIFDTPQGSMNVARISNSETHPNTMEALKGVFPNLNNLGNPDEQQIIIRLDGSKGTAVALVSEEYSTPIEGGENHSTRIADVSRQRPHENVQIWFSGQKEQAKDVINALAQATGFALSEWRKANENPNKTPPPPGYIIATRNTQTQDTSMVGTELVEIFKDDPPMLELLDEQPSNPPPPLVEPTSPLQDRNKSSNPDGPLVEFTGPNQSKFVLPDPDLVKFLDE